MDVAQGYQYGMQASASVSRNCFGVQVTSPTMTCGDLAFNAVAVIALALSAVVVIAFFKKREHG